MHWSSTSAPPPTSHPRVVFAAISATGPRIGVHEPWEVALVERRFDGSEHQHQFFLRPRLAPADSTWLQAARFYERTAGFTDTSHPVPEPFADAQSPTSATWSGPLVAAGRIARATAGAHLVAEDLAFTAAMLEVFLRGHAQAPSWRPRLIDIGAVGIGYLAGQGLPPQVTDLEAHYLDALLGVDPPAGVDAFLRAAHVRDLFDAIAGGAR